ncbi:MAG: cytochrome c biogenesis protein ResB [Candidatus Hydrogenedentes bacterium]|nr:cytochrome c biogenesis protein ResB [Candidatus Hydrogenedentota bacterium]
MVLKTLKRFLDFLSSYGLAAVLFVLLLLLTYLGTLEQVEHGLYLTQKKYFEGFFLIHYFFGKVPVPLPGVHLLLILLFVNILCGGILRLRRGWSQAGVLVAHAGILFLLLGGFITYRFSLSGHMTLYEGEQSNVVESYNEWEVALSSTAAVGSSKQVVLPEAQFAREAAAGEKTFNADALPFSISLSEFAHNSTPQPKGPMFETPAKVVDGFFLKALPLDKEQERNVAGVYATLTEKATGQQHELLLWGLQQYPGSVEIGDEKWTVDLRRAQWNVPFTIKLDKFTRELYPGTNMPKAFMSDVTKIEGDAQQTIKISMNQPLRSQGYTMYQASWGPQDAGPNTKLFSSLAVSRNPADHFPLYACIIITLGMMLHFGIKLRKYLRRELTGAV